MEKLISAKTIQEELKKRGYELPLTTLWYYGYLGLISQSKRSGRKVKDDSERRGSAGLYPASVIDNLITIQELKKKGKSLKDIKEILSSSKRIDRTIRIQSSETDLPMFLILSNLKFLEAWGEDEEDETLFHIANNIKDGVNQIFNLLYQDEIEKDKSEIVIDDLINAFSLFSREERDDNR